MRFDTRERRKDCRWNWSISDTNSSSPAPNLPQRAASISKVQTDLLWPGQSILASTVSDCKREVWSRTIATPADLTIHDLPNCTLQSPRRTSPTDRYPLPFEPTSTKKRVSRVDCVTFKYDIHLAGQCRKIKFIDKDHRSSSLNQSLSREYKTSKFDSKTVPRDLRSLPPSAVASYCCDSHQPRVVQTRVQSNNEAAQLTFRYFAPAIRGG